VNPLEIIALYYRPGSEIYSILVEHSRLVARKALAVAERMSRLNPDMDFIHEAAMVHDIGIFLTRLPELKCTGDLPYICHGYKGRELMDEAGFPLHGRVCERHVGVGISLEDIQTRQLPVPLRDMMPQTVEEKIICYADKFYSKNGSSQPVMEKSVDQIVSELSRRGQDKVDRFLSWHLQFEFCR